MNRWMKRRIEKSRARCIQASGRKERGENRAIKVERESPLESRKQSIGLEALPSQS
jgi:hypothetical protein